MHSSWGLKIKLKNKCSKIIPDHLNVANQLCRNVAVVVAVSFWYYLQLLCDNVFNYK